jgi:hypothetical protein
MKLAINETLFELAGLQFSREGYVGTFYTPEQPDPVQVQINDDDMLIFVPGRSAGHQRVLSLLS